MPTAAKKKTSRTTINQVSNALSNHEEICGLRWEQCYEKFDRLEAMIMSNNQRLWWIAGVVITLLSSLVVRSFF